MSTEQIRKEISNTKAIIAEYLSMDISTEHLEENLRYLENLYAERNVEEAKPKEIKGDAKFCENKMAIENRTDPTMDNIYLELTIETAKQLYRAIKEAALLNASVMYEEDLLK